jgi:hypothetical protein
MFGNSQTLTFETDLKYLESFVRANDRYIFHGFNVNADGIIDFSAINFQKKFDI